MTAREKRILQANEKWVSRDPEAAQRKYAKNAKDFARNFNGKSPEIQLVNNEITWKRPSKFGEENG